MTGFAERVLDGLGPSFRSRANGVVETLQEDAEIPGLYDPGTAAPDTQVDGVYAVPTAVRQDPHAPGLYLPPAGGLLTALVEGLVSGLVPADDLVQPTDRGWAAAFDLTATPAPAWLGRATGTRVPDGLTPEQQRAFVTDRPAWRRGTRAALQAAVTAHLSGTKHVEILERDGSPWRLTVRVYASELEASVETLRAAILTQKPVGIVLTLDVQAGASYAHLASVHGPTYAAEATAFPTYSDATTHVPEEA